MADTAPHSSKMTAPLKVAKLIKLHVFLEADELETLLKHLMPLAFYRTAKLSNRNEEMVSLDCFLERYKAALLHLKKGEIPSQGLSDLYSLSMSRTGEAFEVAYSSEDRILLKAIMPIVQLTPNYIRYSQDEKNFRFGLYGSDAFLFGATISYPQLYQDTITQDVIEIDESPKFPNTALFYSLWRWLRNNTIATPFVVEGKKINVPIRLGRGCLEWVNSHFGLKERGISIYGAP